MADQILLAAEIVSAMAVLLGVVVAVRKMAKWTHNIIEGIRCNLRSDMVNTYYRNKESKHIRQYELENFIKLYSAYKAMNGNSFIDEIKDEVTKWEIDS